MLTGGVVGVAVVLAVLAALLPWERPLALAHPSAVGVASAIALVGLAQLAQLRVRVGRGTVSVSWGETAFVLGFALAPPGWLPAATLVGAAAAWLLITWLNGQRAVADVLHLAACLALGTSGAIWVAYAITGGSMSGTRAHLGLIAGAATYLAITLGLAVLTLSVHRDATPAQIVARALHAKLPMFVGNVLVGLSALYALVNEPLWLLALAPVLWLLQRTYRYHLRAEEERRVWEAFARATRTLGGPTEAAVAEAGLRGALDVFGARRAEIEVSLPPAPVDSESGRGDRRYLGDALPDAVPGAAPGPVISRTMAVGGTTVGELTVWLAEPTMPAARDELAVSAYADVLAGALHDAATRERLALLDARVAHDGVHDQLTGLANRRALLADGEELLRSLHRDQAVAVLLLDLNNFREINGTLGHGAGDDVLRTVAVRLTDLARKGELVARLGDDEFALLLPAVATLTDSATSLRGAPSPLPQAVRRAREIVDSLGLPTEIGGVRLVLDVAVGVVVERAGHADLSELIRRASIALEQAKELHVGVAAYDSARDASSTDHLALPAELHDALIAKDQLILMLQPEVDLDTGAPTGVEALIRWNHPRRGLLTPAVFVETVEVGELLAPFTRYVLDRALEAAAAWAAAGVDVPVSVNVSARSLLDATFPAQVADALRRHRMVPGRLVLEITESVAVSDQGVVDEVLAALREMQVQISVDDFGTGFSSLAFVTRVRVDELKVDRSFVTEMTDSPAAAAVVRGAVELGARLGARVVAEGVETAEQRAALLALGCTAAQGYHFSRPLPVDKIVPALVHLADAAPAKIVPLRADGAS
ncbi:putative bifunctional diguanylate cyclase/phosphodiesterase [Couchioplanes caeruleus]|uniref:Diguanylate cyclase/phosphodiesterase n=1 Tax=Couchioplanes caeruleus TaxID=56438 RepID=A0A3N1GII9_9ACTN|nr:bifunctional diguanylate cyclase/phosphodiesterase [Couchioplanes caeruleus]ROP30057.1 diguanylate cyclase/phosphodiesterase [Couchioplanes caeruleus]